jgi:hypothetical protein
LFNTWLRQPIEEEYKDLIWATAGALAIRAFSSISATSIEEAWPLGTPASTDLEWLRLGAGKMALWHIVDPLREASVFAVMCKSVSLRKPLPTQGTNGVSPELKQLCAMDDQSTQANNPYFTVAHSVSRYINAPPGDDLLHQTFGAMASMNSQFQTLLARKDRAALVLLSLWYSKAGKSKWWIEQRAKYELAAIKAYLRRSHSRNDIIEALLST